MRYIVVMVVKVHGHVAADMATVLDDPLGQHLDPGALNAVRVFHVFKEGADPAATRTEEAADVVIVMVTVAIADLAEDDIAQLHSVGFAFRFVVGGEITTTTVAPTVDTERSDT